jgi:dTDP-glucose 4,6-dehydratase
MLVTITGCLGFIGSHITRKCLEKGWQVYGIDKCTYAANMDLIPEFSTYDNFTFIKKDIATLDYLPDCDYVINTAAESHVGNSIINSDAFIDSNIVGTKNLLDLIRHKPKNTFKRPIFLHFSTDEVYGDILQGGHSEGDILKPSNPYSAAKAGADMLVLAWARTYDINYLIVRPTNNYGKYQYPEKLIPLCVKALQCKQKIKLHDKGEPYRCWLHAKDTARAVITLIESEVQDEIYNISGGFEQPNKETVRQIIESFHGDSVDWIKYIDLSYTREGQDLRYWVDDSKIRELGWSPQATFSEEIKEIVEFYKENFRW